MGLLVQFSSFQPSSLRDCFFRKPPWIGTAGDEQISRLKSVRETWKPPSKPGVNRMHILRLKVPSECDFTEHVRTTASQASLAYTWEQTCVRQSFCRRWMGYMGCSCAYSFVRSPFFIMVQNSPQSACCTLSAVEMICNFYVRQSSHSYLHISIPDE